MIQLIEMLVIPLSGEGVDAGFFGADPDQLRTSKEHPMTLARDLGGPAVTEWK
jgi:hypothetical protein